MPQSLIGTGPSAPLNASDAFPDAPKQPPERLRRSAARAKTPNLALRIPLPARVDGPLNASDGHLA